jgi:hypothetical protein
MRWITHLRAAADPFLRRLVAPPQHAS